jgi:threonine/homoserine/homoserine lactone efflux protein
VLIIALLAGTIFFFHNIVFLTLVGTIGGFFLVIFGIVVIRDVSKTNFDATFTFENDKVKGFKGNSFIGGIVVSLSNPFWTFWWAVIGLGFMASFNISFENPLGILLFFIGHELGDMIFYLPLSTFVYYGGKSLNSKVYKYILIVCGAFMIIFGSYLAFNIIFNPPSI